MKISEVTSFTFSILILDLLFYGIFYDIKKHGFVPSRFISQYQNFTDFFLDFAIILAILFCSCIGEGFDLEDRVEEMKNYRILMRKGYLKKQREGNEYVLICTICNKEVGTHHFYRRHKDIYHEAITE